MTTDTDALLATVRKYAPVGSGTKHEEEFNAALDSIAAELEVLSRKLTREIVEHADTDAELERVKAERDEWRNEAESRLEMEQNAPEAEARLDKALSALREIDVQGRRGQDVGYIARAAIAEIEGEAPERAPADASPFPKPRMRQLR